MCGILGSANISKFEVIYEANKSRGNFSSGIAIVAQDRGTIVKTAGHFNFDNIEWDIDDIDYIVGHIQAPTSDEREWHMETTHPFCSEDWIVVHNGVLTNHKSITKKFNLKTKTKVDTEVIPRLLQYFSGNTNSIDDNLKHYAMCYDQQIETVINCVEQLEGTFALCIIYKPTSTVFIVRQGSVLHTNEEGDFSTMKGKCMEPIEEGVVYGYLDGSWVNLADFKVKSPFLFV